MNTCYVIENYQVFKFKKSHANFKSQKIFNKKLEVIAEELLFNAGHIPADKILDSCQLFFSHPSYIDNLIIAVKKRVLEAKLNRVFMNIEQQTLCDKLSIAKFIKLKETLMKYSCDLVIEITERMNCGYCNKLEEGLKILKNAEITLALDDYDLQPEKLPFTLEYFEIIKTIKPKKSHTSYFKDYLINAKELKNKEIIIENIEDKTELTELLNSSSPAQKIAFQGYYLHKPESI